MFKAHNPNGFQVADTVECTYHIHKFVHGRTKKKHVPHAIRAIKMFTYFKMGTSIVKLDPEVNKKVWKKGRKSIQERIRLRFSRRVETREGPHKGEKYTYVTHVPVESFSGLQDVVIEDAKDPVEAENTVIEDVSEMFKKDSEMETHDDSETDAQDDSEMKILKVDPKLDADQESSKAQEHAEDGAKDGCGDKPTEVSGDNAGIVGIKVEGGALGHDSAQTAEWSEHALC